jgi:hypothetical protein
MQKAPPFGRRIGHRDQQTILDPANHQALLRTGDALDFEPSAVGHEGCPSGGLCRPRARMGFAVLNPSCDSEPQSASKTGDGPHPSTLTRRKDDDGSALPHSIKEIDDILVGHPDAAG